MENLELKVTKNASRGILDSVKKVYNSSKDYLNYRMGAVGAVCTGTIAMYENFNYGFVPATLAIVKQAALATFLAGINAKACEKLANKFKSKSLSLTAASILPTIWTGLLIYTVHKVGGTPEATNTALKISALNFPAFFLLGNHYRNKQIKNKKSL